MYCLNLYKNILIYEKSREWWNIHDNYADSNKIILPTSHN